MEPTVARARGDATASPALQQVLEEGYVLVVADYLAGEINAMSTLSTTRQPSAVNDGVAIIEHVKSLPFVDASRIHLWGDSLGANLVLHLVPSMPTNQIGSSGLAAPLWFIWMKTPDERAAPGSGMAKVFAQASKPDTEVTSRNVAPVKAPILIVTGTADPLFYTVTFLHNALDPAGKSVRMEAYENGDHVFFILGGTRFNTGAVDAPERSMQFIKSR